MSATFSTPSASAADERSTPLGSNSPGPNEIPNVIWKNVETQTITADGITFAYRELGKQNSETPVVLLAHLAAVLDNWDPRIVDGLAAKHHVIAFDNRGVGASDWIPSGLD